MSMPRPNITPADEQTTRQRPLSAAPWYRAWLDEKDAYGLLTARLEVTSEVAVRRELVFCVLGGHAVSFELALSATDAVMGLAPFHESWAESQLKQRVVDELSTPQFEPRHKDGELRRHRFPIRKANLLIQARSWVLAQGELTQCLAAIADEDSRRKWLCECPGLGLKSASWLLRTTGLAANLAVLDVHVLRAMAEHSEFECVRLPRDYTRLEQRFRDWCVELGTTVAALDLFLWQWERANRRPSAHAPL
jgi:N-glycosylase/DNA lyase